MELVMIFDMRAPDFGAPRRELYAAALDCAAWADAIGFDVIGLGEHHLAEDGYNPSPLMLGSAFAGRTRRIRLRTSVLLASCYDPVRLAEDLAVAQLVSDGRISPLPESPVPVMLGGMAPKVARAAARIADGFLVPLFSDKTWQPYRDECLAFGKPDPGEYPKQGPTFLWVSEDPDRDWEWIAPHALHVLDSYSRWTSEAYGKPIGPYAGGMTADTLREAGLYRVMTPEQVVAMANDLGDHSSLYLAPLLGGIEPARAWKMLRLFEREVYPQLPRGPVPRWGMGA